MRRDVIIAIAMALIVLVVGGFNPASVRGWGNVGFWGELFVAWAVFTPLTLMAMWRFSAMSPIPYEEWRGQKLKWPSMK